MNVEGYYLDSQREQKTEKLINHLRSHVVISEVLAGP